MLECDLLKLGPDGAWHFTTDAPEPTAAQQAPTQQPRERSQLPRPRPRQDHATPLTGAIGETNRPPLQCSELGPTCARGRGLLALLDAEEQRLPTPPPPRRCGTAGGIPTPNITTAIDSHPPPSEEAQEGQHQLRRASCPEGASASSESPFPQLRLLHIIRRRHAASAISAAARGWAARQILHTMVTAGTTLSTALSAACRGRSARESFESYRRAAGVIAAARRSTIQRRVQREQAQAARQQRRRRKQQRRERAAAEAHRVQQQVAVARLSMTVYRLAGLCVSGRHRSERPSSARRRG